MWVMVATLFTNGIKFKRNFTNRCLFVSPLPEVVCDDAFMCPLFFLEAFLPAMGNVNGYCALEPLLIQPARRRFFIQRRRRPPNLPRPS